MSFAPRSFKRSTAATAVCPVASMGSTTITVRSPSIGQGLVGAFKSIGGGNIEEFAQVCEEARHEAYTRMMSHARELGAHAIVGMRYDATEFMQGATEVLAYGTAVWIEQRHRS